MIANTCIVVVKSGTGTATFTGTDMEVIDGATVIIASQTTPFCDAASAEFFKGESGDPAECEAERQVDERDPTPIAFHVTLDRRPQWDLSHVLPFWTSGFK